MPLSMFALASAWSMSNINYLLCSSTTIHARCFGAPVESARRSLIFVGFKPEQMTGRLRTVLRMRNLAHSNGFINVPDGLLCVISFVLVGHANRAGLVVVLGGLVVLHIPLGKLHTRHDCCSASHLDVNRPFGPNCVTGFSSLPGSSSPVCVCKHIACLSNSIPASAAFRPDVQLVTKRADRVTSIDARTKALINS